MTKICANCSTEISKENGFYMFEDNFLQVKFFSYEDGQDNCFCSQSCACQALMLNQVDYDTLTFDYENDNNKDGNE